MCLALPLKLIGISDDRRVGTVDVGGSSIEVGLELVPEVKCGDYVLVHAGMAIQVLEESEAKETLKLFSEFVQIPDLVTLETDSGDE